MQIDRPRSPRYLLLPLAALLLVFLQRPGLADNVADIIQNPLPQYTSSTCQSYSAAVLLALRNDPRFAINTLQALRDAEIGIRQGVEQSARDNNHYDSHGKLDPRHDDIIVGFEGYTSNIYTLKRTTLKGIDALGDYIGDKTGISSKVPFPIATSVVQTPLMVSVTRVGPNSYGGHLVTVLGVSGPPSSARKYLIVNSAVKVGAGVKLFCDPDEPASQTTYGALTNWTNDLDFKDFGSQTYYAFSVVEK
jgi:hypothetical protein